MSMSQSEIDEISTSFSEAWEEYFGAPAYYLVCLEDQLTSDNELYEERIGKDAVFESRGPIPAIITYNPSIEELADAGLSDTVKIKITFVTKDLREIGIKHVSNKDRIGIIDRDSVTKLFVITEHNPNVQFVDNYIFTNIGAAEYAK